MKTIITSIVTMLLTLPLLAQQPVDFSTMDAEKITSDPALVWAQFGPGGSGNNYHLYWHPTDPNTVFHGPNMGNSYRSTDRGLTYEGILDNDGPGYRTRQKGPVEIYAPMFSHQNPDFGFCTIEDASVIYRTYNRGKSWEVDPVITKVFDDYHINTIAVNPKDDRVWYAGTGTARDCNHFFFLHDYPHGVRANKNTIGTPQGKPDKNYRHKAIIWRTLDQGDTWQQVTPQGIHPQAQIVRLLIHPERPATLYAATTYGFYISKDAGETWTHKTGTGLDNDIIRSMDMHYDRTRDRVTLYAIDLVKYIPNGKTISYNGGVFKSVDEGDTWQNVNRNMPIEKELLKGYSMKKSYYKYALGKWFQKTEKEVETLYPQLPEKLLHSFSMVRVNPSNPDHVLLVNNYKSQFTFYGGMLWRTDDGGNAWYVTLRNGQNWEGQDKSAWEKRNNPTSHNVDWIAQDEWENRDAYDRKAGAVVEFNADGSTIMYQVAKVVCVSEDNGDTWLENDEQLTTPQGEHLVGAGNSNMPGEEIVQDMRIKDKIYLCAGENTIWQTTNDGDLVRQGAQAVYKLNMPNKEKPSECSVGSMAIHPDDVNTFYALQFRQAFFGKLMKSTDAGATWQVQGTLFDPKAYGNPVHMSIHQNNLLIDPHHTNRIYCSVARHLVKAVVRTNAGSFKAFGVYRSMDDGAHFELVNMGLPKGADVQKIVLDPLQSGDLLAAVSGTETQPGGLFRLPSGGDRWLQQTTPKGMVSVHDICFAVDKRMYISGGSLKGQNKHGGVWCISPDGVWQQVFPYKYANHIRVAAYDPELLMVSVPSQNSDMLNPGIYRSTDRGETWFKVNTGNLQADRLVDLAIDYHKRGVYYCSTYGAGYYKAVVED